MLCACEPRSILIDFKLRGVVVKRPPKQCSVTALTYMLKCSVCKVGLKLTFQGPLLEYVLALLFSFVAVFRKRLKLFKNLE